MNLNMWNSMIHVELKNGEGLFQEENSTHVSNKWLQRKSPINGYVICSNKIVE